MLMQRTAIFDTSRRYRYRLTRYWDGSLPTVAFVMLNPSTANANHDDPTLQRCLGFARVWGYGSLTVVNLFAWRATRPVELRRAPDPIGTDNDHHLLEAARQADCLVLAWGNHGAWRGRGDTVIARLQADGLCGYCLGQTKRGQPRHPLYVSAAQALIPFQA